MKINGTGKLFIDKVSDEASTILVIDDQKYILDYIVLLLQAKHFNIIATTKISEALQCMDKYEIDLILADINLGKQMDGISFMQNVRRDNKYPKIPIIAITASFRSDDYGDLLLAGFSDFLAKPFKYDALKAKLDLALQSF